MRLAMDAMMEQAQATSETPVCMAIVDAAGNLEAFAKMDNARLFTRRHAVRKAYSAAVLGINSGAWGQHMTDIGHSVSENGDPMVIYEQGGVVIIQYGSIWGASVLAASAGTTPTKTWPRSACRPWPSKQLSGPWHYSHSAGLRAPVSVDILFLRR